MVPGPVFAGNWIDLNSNITYTEAQLEKRYDRKIRSKFPLRKELAMNRRAAGKAMGKLTLSKKEQAEEAAYEAHTKKIRDELNQAKADNDLLKKVLDYEKAERRLQKYSLSTGVAYVAEVPEVRDEETGEITQEFIPSVKRIAPLAPTVTRTVYDEETGEIVGAEEVKNPAIHQDETERAKAMAVINGAEAQTISTLLPSESGISLTLLLIISSKLGHPVPLSNFAFD